MLKKTHKNVYYRLTPIGILFPSSVTNDTKQVFVTCREINNAKVALINGKIYSILGIINIDKISNWEYIKGKSLCVNVSFIEQEQINDSRHSSFSFKTLSLNDLLSFSINLTDDDNKSIKFNREQKISISNFKIEVFSKWTENKGWANTLNKYIKQDIEEYKKIIETRNKQLADIKKNIARSKK